MPGGKNWMVASNNIVISLLTADYSAVNDTMWLMAFVNQRDTHYDE